ncbi:MAG: cytochrome P450 [Candidatus Eremiobacteraeota bacterium]|nr:cytochrome P450 [Candidatus Eremiobacteraeota bacterium]
MPKRIPGPGRLETLRRLAPNPFPRFGPFLVEMTKRYGHAVAFALPWRRYVFLNDPTLIKDVFVTQQQAFSKSLGARSLRYLLGEGLLTSEDPLHRQMRRIVQPAFHRERVAAYARNMEAHAQRYVERIEPNELFDVHAAMTALTLGIATTTLFGSDESGSTRFVSDALRVMMEEFPYLLLPLGRLWQRVPLPRKRRFDAARRRLDTIIYGLIDRRRCAGANSDDALSMLLAARDVETGLRVTDEQIRDEVMTLFMAGHETTANLLTWALYLLAKHPEADSRLGNAALEGDAGFVSRVLHESMRLYPPAWIIGRESLREVTLVDGSIIAAKTTVFISPQLLHVRPEYFVDPLRFDPDRWLGPEPSPFAFVPFGGGARRCIGEDFAWTEAAILLSAIARRYRFVLEPGTRVTTLASVTLRPAGPVPMRAIARRESTVPVAAQER